MTENVIRFGPYTTRQCLIIDIINNDLIEEAETFNVTLQHPLAGGAKGIKLTPKVATVTVEDRDSMFPDTSIESAKLICVLTAVATVTFESAEYTVQETSSSLRVCVRVVRPRFTSCPVNHPFNLTLLVYDGTACNYYFSLCVCSMHIFSNHIIWCGHFVNTLTLPYETPYRDHFSELNQCLYI